jgi:hypothetical protein
MAQITDFLPYFYVALPRNFPSAEIDSFADDLNVSVVLSSLRTFL